MQSFWILPAGIAFLLSFLLTPLVARLSTKLGIVDRPNGEAKKVHRQPIPLLGGVSIFLSILIVVVALLVKDKTLTSGLIAVHQYAGFFLGGLILMIGGFLDDKFNLPPKLMIWFPLIAAFVAVALGASVSKVTNPFSSVPIVLSQTVSQILTFVWLVVVMYTTKFLDGLDGLATGVSAIGAFMMMLLALTIAYFQPDVALFAFICLAALIGFLFWNFNPATIFLGEGGSTFVGFVLGTLAVIGGGKLGMALLVLSIPFLDVVWVMLRRTLIEHHSPTKGDRKHLHHRLLDLGLSQRQVVLIYYAIAALIGMAGLFLQSREKVILFGVTAAVMVIGATVIVVSERRRMKSL